MEPPNTERAELSVSDHSQLRSLEQHLKVAGKGAKVVRLPGRVGIGEQGALDVLAVFATSSGLITAIKVLPEFLRSRKTGLSITMTVREKPFTMTATNIDEVMPIVERLLND